jgi:hypothetical protein
MLTDQTRSLAHASSVLVRAVHTAHGHAANPAYAHSFAGHAASVSREDVPGSMEPRRRLVIIRLRRRPMMDGRVDGSGDLLQRVAQRSSVTGRSAAAASRPRRRHGLLLSDRCAAYEPLLRGRLAAKALIRDRDRVVGTSRVGATSWARSGSSSRVWMWLRRRGIAGRTQRVDHYTGFTPDGRISGELVYLVRCSVTRSSGAASLIGTKAVHASRYRRSRDRGEVPVSGSEVRERQPDFVGLGRRKVSTHVRDRAAHPLRQREPT